jgi:hypothetical protein
MLILESRLRGNLSGRGQVVVIREWRRGRWAI